MRRRRSAFGRRLLPAPALALAPAPALALALEPVLPARGAPPSPEPLAAGVSSSRGRFALARAAVIARGPRTGGGTSPALGVGTHWHDAVGAIAAAASAARRDATTPSPSPSPSPSLPPPPSCETTASSRRCESMSRAPVGPAVEPPALAAAAAAGVGAHTSTAWRDPDVRQIPCAAACTAWMLTRRRRSPTQKHMVGTPRGVWPRITAPATLSHLVHQPEVQPEVQPPSAVEVAFPGPFTVPTTCSSC